MNKRIIDKYNLNKNWGVPFEVEQKIHEEMVSIVEKSLNCGACVLLVNLPAYERQNSLFQK